MNLKSIVDCPFRPSKNVVYSDSSATGCGAHLNVNGEQVCHKQWDVHETVWHEFYLKGVNSYCICSRVIFASS